MDDDAPVNARSTRAASTATCRVRGDRLVGAVLFAVTALVMGWKLIDLGDGVRASTSAESRATAQQTAELFHCIEGQVARLPDVPTYIDWQDPESPNPALWYQRIIEFGFPRLDLVATRASSAQVISVRATDDPASCGGLTVSVQRP